MCLRTFVYVHALSATDFLDTLTLLPPLQSMLKLFCRENCGARNQIVTLGAAAAGVSLCSFFSSLLYRVYGGFCILQHVRLHFCISL
jgi:hypothetical protein